MIEKELLKLPVADLVPYENNPRVISPEAVNACAESMRQCSALDPIEVDENNVILSGHTRRLALMQLHVDMADVVRYTGLTEEQKQDRRDDRLGFLQAGAGTRGGGFRRLRLQLRQ